MSRSRIWIAVLALVLVVVLVLAWRARSQGATKWRTLPVETGTVAMTISATGTIEPVTKVDVGSQVSGTILKLGADFNDHVRKGQVIAQLDPSNFETAVAQASATLAHAQAASDNASKLWARSRDLFAKGAIAAVDRDAAEATARQAAADVKQAQAQLNNARVNLGHTTIQAPIDGVIVARSVDIGQTVAASLSAPQLFEIAGDLTRMQVETQIDEADIGRVVPGLTATFTVDAFPDQTFGGSVRQVRLQPVSNQNVVTYTTVIDVPNPDLKLKPGMTANVTVGIERHPNVTKVPNAALRFHPPDDGAGKGAAGSGGGGSTGVAGGGRAMAQGRGGAGGDVSGGAPVPGFSSGGGGAGGGGGARDSSAGGHWQGRGGVGHDSSRAGRGRGGNGAAGRDSSGGSRWAGKGGNPDARGGTVYQVGPDGKPQPVRIRTGITDGTYTEVLSDNLAPGTQVIVGAVTKGAAATTQTSLPPGMGGGPGRGFGGGGGRGGGR